MIQAHERHLRWHAKNAFGPYGVPGVQVSLAIETFAVDVYLGEVTLRVGLTGGPDACGPRAAVLFRQAFDRAWDVAWHMATAAAPLLQR